MAEVFRAQVRGPEGFRRELVVKRVLPHLTTRSRFTQMFVNEAKISAFLNHPNIVQIFEFGESEGSYFIAMESVRGYTLREVLTKLRERETMMPVVAAMEITREILVALDYAHNLRGTDGHPLEIVHRDISPSNVMLAETGSVKVLDFGIARAADHMEEEEGKVVKGKVAYLAPEQISLGTVDQRVDVFALGCVLSEMLTGRLLFRSHNDLQKKVALLEQPSPPPSSFNPAVPAAVDAIVLRAVERDADARYASAADMLLDVENYLSSFRSANRSVLRLVRSLGTEPDPVLDVEYPAAPRPDTPGKTGPSASTPATTGGTPNAPASDSESASRGGVTATFRGGGLRPSPLPPKLEGASRAERKRFVRGEDHRRWGTWLAVGGVLTGLLLAGLGGRALFSHLTRRIAAERVAPPKPVAPAPIVLVTFLSKPNEVRIFDAKTNQLLGTTPATLPVTEAHQTSSFRFEKDGFLAVTRELTPDHDQSLSVQLQAAAPGRGAKKKSAKK